VPVRDRSGQIVAVIDVDSDKPAAFDQEDVDGLVRIAALIYS
jgi:GAF domain-containing protein